MKRFKFAAIAVFMIALLLLTGCQKTSYSQEDIGDPPEVIDETTILGKWYFEGNKTEFIEFYEDNTYITSNEGEEGNGKYSLSDDCMTLHLTEETSGIDQDVDLMYGDNILYIIWSRTREQIFTNYIIEEDE